MFSAIDVGSNGIRLAIGKAHTVEHIEVVRSIREPIRLGQDVFHNRAISETSSRKLIDAFKRFQVISKGAGTKFIRAVATSAFREAINGQTVVKEIQQATGIKINIIDADEEARLIYAAVARAVELDGKPAILIDMGGGSVELTLAKDGKIADTQSLKLGAVRLLRMLNVAGGSEKAYYKLVREFVAAEEKTLRESFSNSKVRLCVGTGGNIEALLGLKTQLLKKNGPSLAAMEIGSLVQKLQSIPLPERISRLGLREDRADVIVPAGIVLKALLKTLKISRILVPNVGLKEGLLYDSAYELLKKEKTLNRGQILLSATQIGEKYAFNERHARLVASHALNLFDKTRRFHNMDKSHKLVLEVAAMLHDIGAFISKSSHHKHSYYLLKAEPFIGLSADRSLWPQTWRVITEKLCPHCGMTISRRSPPKIGTWSHIYRPYCGWRTQWM